MDSARLVLWDVDGTLLYSGIGAVTYSAAFTAVTGLPLRHVEQMAGRTERDIASATFARHGLAAPDEVLTEFFAALAQAFCDHRALLRERGYRLPGSRESLAALARVPGVVQSVVTGNVAAVAAEKLSAFGLTDHLDLGVGGYGSEHGDRAALVRLASARAGSTHGHPYRPGQVVVIGDTPNDVAAALATGATAVGVATGHFSAGDLWAAGAHHVLPDLTDPAGLVRLVAAVAPVPAGTGTPGTAGTGTGTGSTAGTGSTGQSGAGR